MTSEADLVILAVPAPEVLRVTGPGRWPAVAAALERIRYDRRSAVGVALDHALLLPVIWRKCFRLGCGRGCI